MPRGGSAQIYRKIDLHAPADCGGIMKYAAADGVMVFSVKIPQECEQLFITNEADNEENHEHR